MSWPNVGKYTIHWSLGYLHLFNQLKTNPTVSRLPYRQKDSQLTGLGFQPWKNNHRVACRYRNFHRPRSRLIHAIFWTLPNILNINQDILYKIIYIYNILYVRWTSNNISSFQKQRVLVKRNWNLPLLASLNGKMGFPLVVPSEIRPFLPNTFLESYLLRVHPTIFFWPKTTWSPLGPYDRYKWSREAPINITS